MSRRSIGGGERDSGIPKKPLIIPPLPISGSDLGKAGNGTTSSAGVGGEGSSGLAIVSLPIEKGSSKEETETTSSPLGGNSRGGVGGSSGRVGGGTLRDTSEDCARCKETFFGEGVERDGVTGSVSMLGRPFMTDCVSLLPTFAELRFRSGLRITLNLFANRPRMLPRFSFFSVDASEGPVVDPRFNERSGGGLSCRGGSDTRFDARVLGSGPNKSRKVLRLLLSRRGICTGATSGCRLIADVDWDNGDGTVVLCRPPLPPVALTLRGRVAVAAGT